MTTRLKLASGNSDIGSVVAEAGYDSRKNGFFMVILTAGEKTAKYPKALYSSESDERLISTGKLSQSMAYFVDVANDLGVQLPEYFVSEILDDREFYVAQRSSGRVIR
ncbi:MAG: hypothetical protein EOP04_07075 [Proteobacteria bacterium]|nr:MAG: hypothetical protein EOP04_07075 [Pseudomonadota bacterium]